VSRSHVVRLPRRELAAEGFNHFYFGRVAGKTVLTNDAGRFLLLEHDAFDDLVAGRLAEGHPLLGKLRESGFLLAPEGVPAFADQVATRLAHVGAGPHLHIVITTLRCNQTCAYCHASRLPEQQAGSDMSEETARQVVARAFESPAPGITFEFQGGEPTLNWPAIRAVVAEAEQRNQEARKALTFSLVTNLTSMTEEIAEWLIAHDVLVCTSLDGPAQLHDWNRRWTEGSSHAEVLRWIRHFNCRYVEMGRDPNLWHVDALMTTTRRSLDLPREIVDEYVSLGIRGLHVRPLNPFGFALQTWQAIGYDVEQYLAFYEQVLDYVIELNRKGVEVLERTAMIFLIKMLTAEDPGYVDQQSPCGAGTGQVAYNHDGRVFPCDEARMLAAMGDASFELGHVGTLRYPELRQHPTVRALALASQLDGLPMCSSCWVKPFCGVCPLQTYMVGGDLFGQRPRSRKCKESYGIASLLLERLARDSDGSLETIFRRWTEQKRRLRPAESV
jgi:His-Xaa-Ser system radical SAM maturase HxsB